MGAGTSPKVSFKSLGLTRPVEYQGSAETAATNTLTDNEATWVDDQFNGANGAYYVEIASGPGAGTTYDITATSAANKRITLLQNLAATVANGVTFKIRKHWTIASVFGAANRGRLAGGNFQTADQVIVRSGENADVYYYQTTGYGGIGWRKGGAPKVDVAGAVLYPDDAILVNRKQTAAAAVVLMGAVKTGQTSVPVFPGNNFVGNVYAAPITLLSSGLYTGDGNTGLAGGTKDTADQVLIWNGTAYDSYFYQTSGGTGTGWRKVTDLAADAGATSIPVASSLW